MMYVSDAESLERVDSWAFALGLIGSGAALRLARADFSTMVDIESNWHRLYYLSKQIGTWLSPFSSAVLHLTEFGIWPSIENRHLVKQVRLSYGESRPIYQVPGHVFLGSEVEDLITHLHLGLMCGWGGVLISDSSKLCMFSHDGWLGLLGAGAESVMAP